MKRNVPIFGFLIGVFAPVLGFLIVFLVSGGNHDGFGDFFNDVLRNRTLAAQCITLSLLINLVPFIYYTNKRLDQTARGILVATMLYAVLVVLIKYVW